MASSLEREFESRINLTWERLFMGERPSGLLRSQMVEYLFLLDPGNFE
jgi:hypothetical protein